MSGIVEKCCRASFHVHFLGIRNLRSRVNAAGRLITSGRGYSYIRIQDMISLLYMQRHGAMFCSTVMYSSMGSRAGLTVLCVTVMSSVQTLP